MSSWTVARPPESLRTTTRPRVTGSRTVAAVVRPAPKLAATAAAGRRAPGRHACSVPPADGFTTWTVARTAATPARGTPALPPTVNALVLFAASGVPATVVGASVPSASAPVGLPAGNQPS